MLLGTCLSLLRLGGSHRELLVSAGLYTILGQLEVVPASPRTFQCQEVQFSCGNKESMPKGLSSSHMAALYSLAPSSLAAASRSHELLEAAYSSRVTGRRWRFLSSPSLCSGHYTFQIRSTLEGPVCLSTQTAGSLKFPLWFFMSSAVCAWLDSWWSALAPA